MRKGIAYLMTAALGVGGLTMVGCEREDTVRTETTATDPRTGEDVTVRGEVEVPDARPAGERIGDRLERGAERTGDALRDASERTGDALRDASERTGDALRNTGERVQGAVDSATPQDARGVSEQLKEVVSAAVTPGGFDDLVERLAQGDRQRLEAFANQEHQDLDQRIENLRSAWQQRYNQDLNLSRATIAQNLTLQNVQAPENAAGTAQAVLPALQGGREVQFSMIREDGAWKLDLNDQVTGEQLKASLMRAIDELAQNPESLPADVNQGYEYVANRVLSALQNPGQ